MNQAHLDKYLGVKNETITQRCVRLFGVRGLVIIGLFGGLTIFGALTFPESFTKNVVDAIRAGLGLI